MWTIQHARDTYNIAHWSDGYCDISPDGCLTVLPDRDPDNSINLYQLAQEVRDSGLSLPVLLRFNDIIHDRANTLIDCFYAAMEENGYKGRYTAVYPIKVNQQHSVVQEIINHPGDQVGLEVGSKSELIAVLAVAPLETKVICNGYKDREYIHLALIGQSLGQDIHIVVEKLSEVKLILEESHQLGIKPLLGVRVRLVSIGTGNWQNTGGEKSKFGLTASQVLQLVEQLKQAEMLESLGLLHFHLGSQIANIHDIQRGMLEAARFYAELHRLSVPIHTVDVGGGLGVDYEGSRSRNTCSINYTIAEYAHNVVHALWEVCSQQGLPQPHIITESGRAMVAHHAVLITNITDIETVPDCTKLQAPANDAPLILKDLWQDLAASLDGLTQPLEVYHEAVRCVDEAHTMYIHGVLSLDECAKAEQYYSAICQNVKSLLNPTQRAHRDMLDELNEKLADKYFCNLSIFQSLPDVWGIDQIFPIIPLHRLDEEPTRRGILQDLTCDSDGRIDHFVVQGGVDSSLPLHEMCPPQQYLLGFFLIGAYQEILGDMHNLFGDTDSVNVVLDKKCKYRLEKAYRGDSVNDLLQYVNFETESLVLAFKHKVMHADVDDSIRNVFIDTFMTGLDGYTYLED